MGGPGQSIRLGKGEEGEMGDWYIQGTDYISAHSEDGGARRLSARGGAQREKQSKPCGVSVETEESL